jgi:Tol biopolymer transport system component
MSRIPFRPAGFLRFLFIALASATSAAAQTVVTPVIAVTPPLTSVIINNTDGNLFNPHVSGDWAVYSREEPPTLSIRYYNFETNIDTQLPLPPGSPVADQLPDVSGSKMVFSRLVGGNSIHLMLFDAATPAAAPIDIAPAPVNIGYLGGSIGGDTVAYVELEVLPLETAPQVVIHDLGNNTSVHLGDGASHDFFPKVSPDGNVVVWERCILNPLSCTVWQAVKTGTAWSVSAVTSPAGVNSLYLDQDTNGSLVVYDATRLNGQSDIYWRPVTGGAEMQLAMPGYQRNPTIAGNFIAFVSSAGVFDSTDLFVYDIAGNRLYQITNTPGVNEILADITQLPNGDLRVVWDSDEAGQDLRSVHGATFSLPSAAPTPAQLLQQLIDMVGSFNLRHGIANSLDVKLQNVQSALAAASSGNSSSACGMLSAFINEVQAQSGKDLTTQEAAQLVTLANQVRAGLGCS